jgi:hypothetical protein
MSVQVQNKTFTDIFGNDTTFLQANCGDYIISTLRVKSYIQVKSNQSGVQFSLDASENIITNNGTGFDFLEEGFRSGDFVRFNIYSFGGSVLQTWVTQVTFVTSNTIDVNSIPFWFTASNNEFMTITSLNVTYGQKREGLILDFNQVKNGTQGSEFSLIDGEQTRFQIDLTTLSTSQVQMTQIGLKSGQWNVETYITDVTQIVTGVPSSSSNAIYYDIEFRMIVGGIYDQSVFDFSSCLKLYSKMKFQRFVGEPFDNYELIFNDDADTGAFNEPFNNGFANSTLVQGINAIAFNQPTTAQIIIDSANTFFGIGSSYVSNDDTYFKNKSQSQSELGMTIETISLPVTTPVNSPLNLSGAGYTLEILANSSVGTTRTIDIKIKPNSAFETFMSERDPLDRRFVLWFKWGNVNHLVFDNQLEEIPVIAGAIDMIVNDYCDHSENVTDKTGLVSGYVADIEDDLAYIGKFRLPEGNDKVETLIARIEAFNVDNEQKFTLQQVTFDISSIPFVSGKFVLNMSQNVISTLPNTSQKRTALLVLDSSIDVSGEYGVKLYFPFLHRWEYWLTQPNANADFYPDEQTKDWFPYDNTGDWTIRIHLQLTIDGLSYLHNDDLTLKDYDANRDIKSNIELFIDSTNQNVGVVTEGLLMRVVGTHELIDGNIWKTDEVWGMITCEPKESSPRFILSSIVPTDFNSLNPLSPLSSSLCSLTFPSPTIAKLECYFDPQKINLSNGVKFTSKIKGCSLEPSAFKLKTDGTIKLTTDGLGKLKAP